MAVGWEGEATVAAGAAAMAEEAMEVEEKGAPMVAETVATCSVFRSRCNPCLSRTVPLRYAGL